MTVYAELLVSDDIQEFMLGYNWLAAQGVHWYFDRKVLVLRGKEIPLQLRPSRASVSRVLACERVVLAPLFECDVPVKPVRESWRVPKVEWLLESQSLAKGVHVAHVLLPDGGVGVAVHVVNETWSPFTVAVGSEVGPIWPVKCIP